MKRWSAVALAAASMAVAAADGGLTLTEGEVARMLDWRRDTYLSERGKKRVDCAAIPRGAGTAVLLILGQSNASNEGKGARVEKAHVYNFNVFTGRCFMASDPLLGTTGKGAGFAMRLGAMLVDAKLFSDVVLVPIAVGGTRVRDWAPGGAHHPRALLALKRLKSADLPVTFALWHQGEGDATPDFSKSEYKRHFMGMFTSLRLQGTKADFFVPLASLCRDSPHSGVREAQAELVDPKRGIYAGPDTDTLGLKERFDGCHFSSRGLDKHARLWFETLRQFIQAKDRSALPRVTAKTIGAGPGRP